MKKNDDILLVYKKLIILNYKYKREYEYCSLLINTMCEYYEIHDLYYQSNLSPIFRALYIDVKDSYLSEIADNFFIDLKTLYRYRLKFNKLAYLIIDKKGLNILIENLEKIIAEVIVDWIYK